MTNQTQVQHTPGPWHFDKSGNIATINEHEARPLFEPRTLGKLIASAHMDGGNLPVEANARLIASAPDLLAALEALIEYYGDDDDMSDARAAVRRARGED